MSALNQTEEIHVQVFSFSKSKFYVTFNFIYWDRLSEDCMIYSSMSEIKYWPQPSKLKGPTLRDFKVEKVVENFRETFEWHSTTVEKNQKGFKRNKDS